MSILPFDSKDELKASQSFKMTITEQSPVGVRSFNNNLKVHQAGVEKVVARMKLFLIDETVEELLNFEEYANEEWQAKAERLVLLSGSADQAIEFFDKLVKVMPKLTFNLIEEL
jgi:hypothetical protein